MYGLIGLMMVQGCSSSNEPSRQEQVKKLLIADGASWLTEGVSIDDTDGSDDFAGLSLTFGGSTYSAVNGRLVWPANGTWGFVSEDAKSFVRDDGVEVEIEELTNEVMTIALEWTETTFDTGGKVKSRKGKHRFRFRRLR